MALALGWNNERGHGRLLKDEITGAFADEQGLGTAGLLTLYTWAPATAEEIAEAGLTEQLGWWGDAPELLAEGERVVGSKLWLLSRRGTRLATLRKAEEYARQAFAWWIEDGLASSVEVVASRPQPGVLGLKITLTKPDGDAVSEYYESTVAVL